MAIQWGSWAGTSPRRMRLGVDFTSVPAPSASATAVTVSADIYIGAEYSISDSSNNFSWSGTLGSGSGSRSVTPSTNGSQRLQAISASVAVSTSPTTVRVSASLSGVEYVGATATVTATATIPAKPQNPPGQPGAVTMTRIKDTSHRIAWGASSGTVTRYKVELQSRSTGAWALLGYTTATAWATGVTKANDGYRARVTAEGPGGRSSTRTQATYAHTSPAAPTGVSATRVGSSIAVSWTDRSPFNDTFEIYASNDGGGTWTLYSTYPNASGSPWTLTAPDPLKPWTFEVVSVITASASGVNAKLSSSRVRTNTVQLATPPAAPSLLTPLGVTLDPAQGSTRFTWRHNTQDSSEQTAYSLRYRLVDTSAWTTHTVTSAAQYRVVALTELGDYEWQVQTRGQHANYGPWSALGRFTAAESPAVAISTPEDGATLPGNRVAVTWAPTVSEGETVVRWVAQLLDEAGAVLATRSADNADTTAVFTYTLANHTTYQVAVSVTDSNGLTSPVSVSTFTTDFALPSAPSLTATWSAADASVSLVPTASPGETFAWTGAAHASTSTRTVGGKTVTNRATNPSFESDSVPVGGVRSDAWAADGTWSLYVTGEGYGYGLSPYGETPYGL